MIDRKYLSGSTPYVSGTAGVAARPLSGRAGHSAREDFTGNVPGKYCSLPHIQWAQDVFGPLSGNFKGTDVIH